MQAWLITKHRLLISIRPRPVEGFESIHISTSSMRTDYKRHLAALIAPPAQN